MKSIVKFVVIALFLFGTIFGALAAYGIWQDFEQTKERKNLADQWIPAIVSNWDADKFLENSDSSALLGTFTEGGGIESLPSSNGRDAVMKFFEKKNATYGKMKTYNGAECAMDFKERCVAIISFERGSARIEIKTRHNKILAFLITDTALLQKFSK